MSNKNFDLIFEEWKASLKTRDRSKNALEGNFEDFFNELKNAGATFEEAHAWLPKAVKAHLPSPVIAKNAYKMAKSSPRVSSLSEKEFIESWHENIDATATNVFFSVFPREKPKVTEANHGNIPAREYKAMRAYADSFPILDVEGLKAKRAPLDESLIRYLNDILGEDDVK